MQISNPFLNKYIIPPIVGNSVLDIGCGVGYYGFLCKYAFSRTEANAPFSKIDAVETSLETIENLKNSNIYNNIHYVTDAFLPLPDNSYDTVLSIEVLEHLYKEDLEIAFKELYRVCNKRLIVSTPPPELCSNRAWCLSEIDRIKRTVAFLSYDEYMEHRHGLHKCCINSDVFMDMGFRTYADQTGRAANVEGETRVYIGNKSEINIDKFKISFGTSHKLAPLVLNKNYKEEVIEMMLDQSKIGL